MKRPVIRVSKLAIMASAMFGFLPWAAAQQAPPNPDVPVQDRPRPRFDALGVRAGGFLIFPSIGVEGQYDSNALATSNNEQSDYGVILRPRIRARSQFSRHRLDFTAGAEIGRFEQFDENNYEDFDAGVRGRLDITRAQALGLNLTVAREHEDRSDPDQSQSENVDVTQFWNLRLGLDYTYHFNRLFVRPSVGVQRLDFKDNSGINEDDRDRNRYTAGLRVGYAISPRINVFGQGTYDIRRYDQTPDDAGFDRDSNGYEVGLGTGIDITSILFGEVRAGYAHRDYDDNQLDSTNGLNASGQLTWNVTPLTSIIGTVSAEILETTVTFKGEDASSDFRSQVGIDVNHELLRNLLLNGNLAYVRDDFEGTDRTDNEIRAGAGVRYLINRNFSLDARYRFRTQESDANDAEFDRHQVFVGVVAKL